MEASPKHPGTLLEQPAEYCRGLQQVHNLQSLSRHKNDQRLTEEALLVQCEVSKTPSRNRNMWY